MAERVDSSKSLNGEKGVFIYFATSFQTKQLIIRQGQLNEAGWISTVANWSCPGLTGCSDAPLQLFQISAVLRIKKIFQLIWPIAQGIAAFFKNFNQRNTTDHHSQTLIRLFPVKTGYDPCFEKLLSLKRRHHVDTNTKKNVLDKPRLSIPVMPTRQDSLKKQKTSHSLHSTKTWPISSNVPLFFHNGPTSENLIQSKLYKLTKRLTTPNFAQ